MALPGPGLLHPGGEARAAASVAAPAGHEGRGGRAARDNGAGARAATRPAGWCNSREGASELTASGRHARSTATRDRANRSRVSEQYGNQEDQGLRARSGAGRRERRGDRAVRRAQDRREEPLVEHRRSVSGSRPTPRRRQGTTPRTGTSARARARTRARPCARGRAGPATRAACRSEGIAGRRARDAGGAPPRRAFHRRDPGAAAAAAAPGAPSGCAARAPGGSRRAPRRRGGAHRTDPVSTARARAVRRALRRARARPDPRGARGRAASDSPAAGSAHPTPAGPARPRPRSAVHAPALPPRRRRSRRTGAVRARRRSRSFPARRRARWPPRARPRSRRSRRRSRRRSGRRSRWPRPPAGPAPTQEASSSR